MRKQTIFNQFVSVGIGALINLIVGFVTTPIITRIVDPSVYGRLSLFNTYATMTMMFVGLGMDQVLLRYFYEYKSIEYKKNLIAKCTFYPVVFLCVCCLVGGVVFFSFNDIDDMNNQFLFFSFILYVFVLLINRISLLVVRLNKKTNFFSALSVIQKILYVSFSIPLTLCIKNNFFNLLVIATLISYIFPTIASLIVENKYFLKVKRNYNCDIKIKDLMSYGIPMMLSSSIFILFQAIDKISLEFFCNHSEVGIYSSAASIMSIITIIRTSFTSVWMPVAVENYSKKPDNKDFYIKVSNIVTLVMFLFGNFLMFSKDLIVLFLGEKYRSASTILPFLMFQPIMYTISETTVVGLIFKNKSKYQTMISIAVCFVNTILNILFIPRLGAIGAAISTGISYIVFFSLRTFLSQKFYYIKFDYFRIIMSTLMSVLYALFTTFNSFNVLYVLFFFIIVFVLAVLYRDSFKHMVKYIKNIIRREYYE